MKYKTRRYFFYYLLRIAFFILGFIPLKISLVFADLSGRLASRMARAYTRKAVRNLDSVYSDDHAGNVKIARAVFSNIAKNGAEWIKLSVMDPRKLGKIVTECTGMEKLDRVLSCGRGALVLGFHFGNWELLGMYLRYAGYEGSLVAKRIYFHKYNKLLERLRGRYDAPTIYRDESPRRMLKELRAGRILGIVPDQDVDSVDGEFVEFFGRPAFTPTAPVKLAMAAKTSIVPVFVVRKPDNTHKIIVEDPIDVSSLDKSGGTVKNVTQQWSNVLEKYVREYPDQWVWIHERWRTSPLKGNSETGVICGEKI